MSAGNFISKIYPLNKKLIFVLFITLFLIFFVFISEYVFRHYLDENWREISGEKDKNFEEDVKVKFIEYQNNLLKNSNNIKSVISNFVNSQPLRQRDLFEILNAIEDENVSANLYDKDGKLVAWKKTITVFDSHNFMNSDHFFVSHTNIYKLLNFSTPLKIGDTTAFYLVLTSILDYNFPISNRFLSINLKQKIFTRELDRNITFLNKLIDNNDPNAKIIKLPSLNEANSHLGYIQYYRLTQEDIIYELENYFKVIKIFLFLIAGLILFVVIHNLIHKNIDTPFKEFAFILGIWILRYFILMIGFPSNLFDHSIFNPFYFASDFGYGIVKNIGELLITSITLFITVILLNNILRHLYSSSLLKIKSSLFKIVIVIFIFTIILFLLRGYVATIVSAVKDSNLNYVQQTEVVPSFEKIVVFISLLLVTFSFIILILQLLSISYRILEIRKNLILGCVKLCVISLFVILLYQAHPNPLVNFYERFSIIFGFILLSYFVSDIERISVDTKNFIIIMLSSAVLQSFVLISKIDEDREQKLLDLAKQVSQPFDDWMAFIVDEALNEMLNSSLLQTTEEWTNDLSFNLWARNILSQKGYDCELIIVDTNLNVISKFGIGSFDNNTFKIEYLPDKKVVKVQESSLSKGGLKYYSGYAPIYNNTGEIKGAIFLNVASSRSELLRPDYTKILVTEKYERDYFFKETFYAEFRNGYLDYSTNQEFPKTLKLEHKIIKDLNDNNQNYYLVNQIINNKPYKVVYWKSDNDNLSSLGIEVPAWKKYEVLRLFIYLIIISGALYVLISFKKLKSIYQLSFFIKLSITFIVVSIVPLFIFSYYSNRYAQERMISIIIENMRNETELIIKHLKSDELISTQYDNSHITDEVCQEVSNRTGIDFIFYRNGIYTSSSMPELLQAELINKVLSEQAYKNIILDGRKFFYEPQNIGSLNYYAGYRPLIDNSGSVSGVVAVLTLSKMPWIEEEIAERNINMFAIYFIVLIFVLGTGILISRQISMPLKNLANYTKIIADGNLDVKIGTKRQDEIGKLENAFDKMTADLKQKRDELIKIEKEIAWREMAKQVAHEIKNPLTPIKLSIQQLYKAYKDGAKNFDEIFKQAYEMISEQIETLNRIASEFSNFARMPERRLEICSVNTLIDEAIQLFAQYQGISFIKNYCSQDLHVIADRDELRRAIVNIIRNSVQAIGNNGRIEVTTQQQDERVIISIEDNGAGIPDDVAKRIFEPNFSTKSDGMGLGLAIVKKTIEDLNGEISFTTKVGEGTKFIIKLKILKSE